MRNRINKNLVGTTSESESKKRFAKKNRSVGFVFTASVCGKKHRITKDQYDRLKKAGYKVEVETI